MKRRHALVTSLAIAALGFGVTAGTASAATVELHPSGGIYGYEYLVASSGLTLYTFTKDKGSMTKKTHEKCQRIKHCTENWPPLTVTEAPTAGAGVNPALLGTIMLRNGSQQVTYAGRPLYTNLGEAPFEIYYFGTKEFRGNWDGMNAAGGMIT
jgi:predicted lipoprotein with Yx(FWY)xxD motif